MRSYTMGLRPVRACLGPVRPNSFIYLLRGAFKLMVSHALSGARVCSQSVSLCANDLALGGMKVRVRPLILRLVGLIGAAASSRPAWWHGLYMKAEKGPYGWG